MMDGLESCDIAAEQRLGQLPQGLLTAGAPIETTVIDANGAIGSELHGGAMGDVRRSVCPFQVQRNG